QTAEDPAVERRVGMTAQGDLIAEEDVARVHRGQRGDLGGSGLGQGDVVVALNGLGHPGQAKEDCEGQQWEERALQPVHRNTGLRPAVVSSTRLVRVECGAVFTRFGSDSASRAIEIIASMN